MAEEKRRQRIRDLSLNQKLTLGLACVGGFAALASLFVAIAAVVIASDSRDMKSAIGELRTLAHLTNDQLREQQEQTKSLAAQADAAQIQAKATQVALGISDRVARAAENQAQTSQEAFRSQVAGQVQIDIKLKSLEAYDWQVEFTFTNVGSTTIRDAELYAGVIVRRVGDTSVRVWPSRPARTATLAPHETVPVVWKSSQMPPDPMDLTMGLLEMLAAGEIRFRDPGQTTPASRSECRRYVGDSEPGTLSWRPCFDEDLRD